MRTRRLPRAEFARLEGTEVGPFAAELPDQAVVLVVEDDDGAIVGTWAIFPCVHVEGVWIAPGHRKRGGVARALVTGMRTVAQDMGARGVVTGALTEEVRTLICHLKGSKLPGEHYVIPVGRHD